MKFAASDQGSRAVAMALMALGLGPTAAASPPARPLQSDAWQVTCAAGADEFASNCQAVAHVRDLNLTMATGGEKLVLSAGSQACPEAEGAEVSIWRDTLIGLSAAARRRRLLDGFRQAIDAARAQCPPAGQFKATFGSLPDLTMVGDPPAPGRRVPQLRPGTVTIKDSNRH